MSIGPSICPSVHLHVIWSIYMSICMSVCPSILCPTVDIYYICVSTFIMSLDSLLFRKPIRVSGGQGVALQRVTVIVETGDKHQNRA